VMAVQLLLYMERALVDGCTAVTVHGAGVS